MICPSCRNSVPDTAVICDHCNHILDASFLGDEITNDAHKAAPPLEQATKIKSSAQVEAERAQKKAAPKAAAASATRAAQAAAVNALYTEEEESTAAGKARRSLDEIAAVPQQTTEALDDLVRQYRTLPRSEKITATGVGLLLLSLALPWRGTKEDGDLIGLMAGGWPVLILALVAGAAVFVRRHEKVRRFKQQVLQGAVGAGVLSFLFCGMYVKTAVQSKPIRMGGHLYPQYTMWPEFGVFVGIIAAAIVVGGAVKSYMSRDSLPD